MLAKAKECWEQEQEEREAEKSRYLAERIPTLQTRGLSLSALQVSEPWGWGWGWAWAGWGPGSRLPALEVTGCPVFTLHNACGVRSHLQEQEAK